ncbi:AsmA-like C-terminal region-containing protein [Flavobacterium beibuense]|uniref:Putative outer membrane protein n=1 Tax=Flavobacterium beibuense TaxID=657326 RepID=A0A444W5V2_9FLAO|nr:AsmA-like C-terminal region-containing protein [Flavobacterium beibuense]RYJ41227.1 putative outer membrane protein [Flavobacterium beibuense]
MIKKILKWAGIILLILIIALVSAPFLFKGKIKSLVLKTINEQVDATVAFEDVSLSLFRNFPMASVSVEKLSIINKAPFEGDTLVYMGNIDLTMSVKELFKGEGEPMNLESFSTKDGVVNILINKDGIGNFDIALKDEEDKPGDDSESKPFALNIQDYAVENLRLKYYDESSKMKLVIDSLYHDGKGNFAASKLDLDTHTTAKLSFDMDKTNYMRDVALKLDAVLGIDLENSIYTFKENKAFINQLPLEFDGSVALKEEGQQIDLTFKTPTSSFKNFLGLVPEAYSGNLSTVKTEGDFTIDGKVKGLNGENSIPTFNVAIASNNASFKYPDLPKSVQNIVIDTKIINETGILNDTYVNLDKLSFRIDQDVFNAKATIRNIVDNALVDADLNGTINLANVSKAYPVQLDTPLSGILKANLSTKFDMLSVEKSEYEKMQNNGSMSLSGFTYSGDGMAKPVSISQASIQFNPSRITLSEFKAKTGGSDISVTGTLDNFYGFIFKDQTLKGNFDMSANQLLVADFMAPEAPETKAKTEEGEAKTEAKPAAASEAVKIPAFLDCTITARANTVVYDNLNLKNVSGKMVIKDEAVALQNVTTDIFGGKIGFNGNVSTKAATPTFKMDLTLSAVDIVQSFTQLDMLKSIAPIANVLTGKLNSTINVSGNLDSKEMTPDLNSLTGDLLGQLMNTSIKEENSKLLTALDNNLKFIDLSKVNLDNLKTYLSFENGKVNIKPFNIKYQDITVQVGGQHGFDQSINYNVAFDVPAKYLGSDVNKLLSSLNSTDASKISVPVNANITGSFDNPKVSTDVSKAVTDLTQQLVKQQTDKYKKEGEDKLKETIGGLLGGNKKEEDKTSTTTDQTKTNTTTNNQTQQTAEDKAKEAGKDLINGLFKKDKKKEE